MTPSRPDRILVVSPHPDDEAIGCGGTVAKRVAAGAEAKVIFLTSGENGGHDVPPDETREQREAEARDAAGVLGVGSLEFWRRADGALRADRSVVERLHGELRAFSPTTVFAPHATELHPDHRAAARLVSKAAAGLDVEVLFFEVWTPLTQLDEIVDITPTIEVKLTAIRAYESQCRVMRFDDAFRGLARYRGEMFSWPEGDYAEVFRRGRARR